MPRSFKKAIPSIFTLANLAIGFIAICCGDLYVSCMLIITCMLLDNLDGVLARKLNVQSLLGKELDSLCDMVSFGVAPAVLYVQYSYFDTWYTALAAVPFVLGAAMRLAKFNIIETSHRYIGLASPVAALFMVGVLLGVYFEELFFTNLMRNVFAYFAIPSILMFLMNSRLEMFTFKSVGKSKMDSTLVFICFASLILLLIIDFKIALPISVMIYLFLSVLQKILAR